MRGTCCAKESYRPRLCEVNADQDEQGIWNIKVLAAKKISPLPGALSGNPLNVAATLLSLSLF